jgi:5,10-methylenetetrahydromethanopterin reductase
MKLGVSLGISPRQPLKDFAEQAVQLEAAGVERLWLLDSQLATKDVYVGLALAALRTNKLAMGPGVTNPVTRHPSVTAAAIQAIAELAPKRTLLGVGAGDSAVYGIGARPAKLAEMEAALSYLREALPGIPIYVAVSQPKMCRLAGRLADGAIVMGPSAPAFVRRQVAWIEEGLAGSHRSRRQFDICLVTTLAEKIDDVRAWAASEARLIADFAELPEGLEVYEAEIAGAKAAYDFTEHLSVHAGHKTAVSDGLARALAVAGPAQDCADKLGELLQTGADNLIFPLPGGGRLERLRFITDQVLTRL